MGNASAKFIHPFNEPMIYVPNTSSAANDSATVAGNFLNGNPSRFNQDTFVKPQFGAGPPIPGRANVDSDGNLAFSGGGYTYLSRLPNEDENGFTPDRTKLFIHDITRLSNNFEVSTNFLFNRNSEVAYSWEIIEDKNDGPAIYLHTDQKLKKGRHIVSVLISYGDFGGSEYYYFGNWYDV